MTFLASPQAKDMWSELLQCIHDRAQYGESEYLTIQRSRIADITAQVHMN